MNREVLSEKQVNKEAEILSNANNKRQEMRLEVEERRNIILSALLMSILILALSICSIFASNNKKYSENENRYLASKPKLSFESLLDGRFTKDTDTYLSDHFIVRDTFVKSKTYIDIFLGKSDINDIYIGKNHYLFEKPSELDKNKITETLNKINTFTENNKDVKSHIALIPNSSDILHNLMPHNAPYINQRAQIRYIYNNLKDIDCIDVYSQFLEAGNKDEFYYKTDHHWTTLGAEKAFFEIAKNMQLDTSKVTYTLYSITNDFQGTLSSSSGLFSAKDMVFVPALEPKADYTVNYVDEERTSNTLYDYSKLNHKNKYEVFFGGNYSQINIDINNESDKVLLVIKDSYANCLIPMLLPYYKKIVIIDPRYYFGDINRLVKIEGVTDIFWLYNVNTFLNDTSINDTFE